MTQRPQILQAGSLAQAMVESHRRLQAFRQQERDAWLTTVVVQAVFSVFVGASDQEEGQQQADGYREYGVEGAH